MAYSAIEREVTLVMGSHREHIIYKFGRVLTDREVEHTISVSYESFLNNKNELN